jgi:hypothetical protein
MAAHADAFATVAAVSDRRPAVGTPPLQNADLKVGATILCCPQADRARTNAVARMKKACVLRNPMATSRAVRGLGEIQILLQTGGIATFAADSVVVQFYVEAALRRRVAR